MHTVHNSVVVVVLLSSSLLLLLLLLLQDWCAADYAKLNTDKTIITYSYLSHTTLLDSGHNEHYMKFLAPDSTLQAAMSHFFF